MAFSLRQWRQTVSVSHNEPVTQGSVAVGVIVALLVLAVSTGVYLFFRQLPDPAVYAAQVPADGCGADRWWAQVNTLFARVEYQAFPDAQPSAADVKTQLALWQGVQSGLSAVETPDCLASARADLIDGVSGEVAAYTTDAAPAPDARMKQVYAAMLKYQSAAVVLQSLGVHFDSSTRFGTSMKMLISDCPAQLWLLETLYVKNDFFRLLQSARAVIYASDPSAAAQNYVLDLSHEELTLKYASNPPCAGPAKAHLISAMEAYVAMIQAYQGRDENGIVVHLQTMQTELTAFQHELALLGVTLDIG